MLCAISGKPPKEAVISLKSKCIFEKSLIEQYIKENGQDPVSNEPLTLDDLLEIKQQNQWSNSVNSATLNTNYSIPNLLSTLQNEWDAIMLENFKLRKELDACTKKLSNALFERDAAKMVAARILQEKEQLLVDFETLVPKEKDVEISYTDILKTESEEYVSLTAKRKEKFLFPSEFKVELQEKYEKSNNFVPSGPSSYSLLGFDENKCTIVSGDSNVLVKSVSKTVSVTIDETLLKYISTAPNGLLLYATDSTVNQYNTETKEIKRLPIGSKNIIYMYSHESILPNSFVYVTDTGETILVTKEKNTYKLLTSTEIQFKNAAVHKDGLLLALSHATEIYVYNYLNPEAAPTIFSLNHEVVNIQFSSNGYWMVVQTVRSIIAFDLRKDVNTKALDPLEFDDGEVVAFDMHHSGKHLVVLTTGGLLRFYSYKKSSKSWELHSEPLEIDRELSMPNSTMRLLYNSKGQVGVVINNIYIQLTK